MRLVILALALHVVQAVDAQPKYGFQSQTFVGVLGGDSDAAIQIQSINGVRRGTWSAGVGVGLDHYYHRTIPLFLSINKYLSEKRSGLFVSLDGGLNFIWDNSTANRINLFSDDGDFSPALYYGAHAGYKIGQQNKKGSLLIMMGYSRKEMKERFTRVFLPCDFAPCAEYDEKVHYRLNRYSVKVGWMF